GRAVPRKSGVRTPESRGTYPRKPGWNNTKVEQDEGLPLLPARAEAAAPPRPRRSEEEEEKKTTNKKKRGDSETPRTNTPEDRAIRVVLDRLADHSPTEDEARAAITHIRNQATQRGTTIARIETSIDGRHTPTLLAALAHIRPQTPRQGPGCGIPPRKSLPCRRCAIAAS